MTVLKLIENLKRQKWDIMPRRIKAYQTYMEKKRAFNKLLKEEKETERMLYEAMLKRKNEQSD
jgi:hypothetical protein